MFPHGVSIGYSRTKVFWGRDSSRPLYTICNERTAQHHSFSSYQTRRFLSAWFDTENESGICSGLGRPQSIVGVLMKRSHSYAPAFHGVAVRVPQRGAGVRFGRISWRRSPDRLACEFWRRAGFSVRHRRKYSQAWTRFGPVAPKMKSSPHNTWRERSLVSRKSGTSGAF